MTIATIGSAIGALVLVIGLFVDARAVAASYLVAYTTAVATAIGMLLLVMTAHLSGAVWFVLLRRRAEAVVAALPVLAVLALPLLVMPHPQRAYFDPVFFAARSALYWVVWLACGERLLRLSRRQDAAAADVSSDRFRVVSAVGLPLAGVALTFASFDWMMSLTPEWTSTVYGAYYSAGGIVSALALLAVLALETVRRVTPWSPTTEHVQALGRLTLAFVLFWAYLWYVQFFIIWIGDLPREASWYVVRFEGGWGVLGRTIVAAAFVLPFLVLAFRAARGSALVMAGAGVWLFIAHYLNVYWLVVPSAQPQWSPVDLVWDAGALLFVGGSATAFVLWRDAMAAPVPMGDPLLEWSVRYHAQ